MISTNCRLVKRSPKPIFFGGGGYGRNYGGYYRPGFGGFGRGYGYGRYGGFGGYGYGRQGGYRDLTTGLALAGGAVLAGGIIGASLHNAGK